MDDKVVLPAMVDCTRLHARVTTAGCSSMWKSAHSHHAPKPWESRSACVGCALGAMRSGQPIETAREAARTQEVAAVCVRCGATGRRMVKQTHCVSCYNRLREALRGRDARGRAPRHKERLFQVRLVLAQPAGTSLARVFAGVTTRAEALLTVAKRHADSEVAIGWARLAELPAASQPELYLPDAPRVPPPRRPRAPACPVSILLPEPLYAAA